MPAQSSLESFDRTVSCDHGLPGEKLDETLARFVVAAQRDPFTTWLILPTRRLVLYASDTLAVQNVPVIPSRICTLEGFCSVLFEENRTTERFLPPGEAKLLLTDILAMHAKNVPLFAPRDRPSPGTIDDLMTFMNVILTRKVAFPECLLELQSTKSDQLDLILTEYRNRLREEDLFDGDTILQWTIDHLDRCERSPLGTVFIYGFHEPLPLEEDLFRAIEGRAGRVVSVIPDGIDPEVFPRRAAAGVQPGFDPASRSARITGLFAETDLLVQDDHFRLRTFPARYAEAAAIAAEIRRLNAGGIPLSDIAVAFPDLREHLGLIEEIFTDCAIPWNAAVGPRLSQSPVIQFYLAAAGLASGRHTRGNVVRLIGSPYFRRGPVPLGSSYLNPDEVDLVSRYAGIDGPYPDWDRQLGWLCRQLEDPHNAQNFRGITPQAAGRVREGIGILLRSLDALSGNKTLRDHLASFKAFLRTWGIPDLHGAPDEDLKQREIRASTAFTSRLDSLTRIAWIPADTTIRAEEFFRLVSAVAEEPDDSRRQDGGGVSLLGIRECVHMTFPVLFLGGLVEGAIPRLTTRLPFTNALENARMGTRSLSGILREGEYYFIAALLAGKRTVYLSAPLADGEKMLLSSAFFERVRARAGDCPWPGADGEGTAASQRTAAVRAGEAIRSGTLSAAPGLIPDTRDVSDLVERINTERYHRSGACDSPWDGILSGDEAIVSALAARFSPGHVWSPTRLETYAGCPFAYFLERILGIEALPEVELNLSASDRGTVIHDILRTFYRQWQAGGRSKVLPANLTEATDLILRIAGEELEKYSFSSPLWDATRVMMLGDPHTGPGYFERFLERESDEADSALVPARFEFAFGMEPDGGDDPASVREPVDLVSPDGSKNLRIRGRIDRIDFAPDGRFLIWDYKSGLQHPTAAAIVSGVALQIPLYLLAFERITGSPGIGGGYYTIRRDVERNIVLADPAARDLLVSRIRPSADFAGIVSHSRECAFAYIDGIRNGRFPLPPKEACPNRYCDFTRICRFDPYRILDAGGET